MRPAAELVSRLDRLGESEGKAGILDLWKTLFPDADIHIQWKDGRYRCPDEAAAKSSLPKGTLRIPQAAAKGLYLCLQNENRRLNPAVFTAKERHGNPGGLPCHIDVRCPPVQDLLSVASCSSSKAAMHSSTDAPASSSRTIRQVLPHCSIRIPALDPST